MLNFRPTTWVIAVQPIKQVTGFIVSIILARILTPFDYGVVAAGQTLVGFLWIFSSFGTYEAAVQKKSLSDDESDIFFTLNVILGIILFICSCISAQLLAYFFKNDDLLVVIPMLSTSFIFSSTAQVHNSLLARSQQYNKMILLELSGLFPAAIVAVIMAFTGFGYWSLVALNILMIAVPSVAVWFFTDWRPKQLKISGIKDMRTSIRFSLSVAVGNWLNYFANQIDRIVLGRIYKIDDLGLYSRSHQLAMYANNFFFVGPHRFVTARLSRLQQDIDQYRKEFLRLISIALWGSVWINFLLALNARGVIRILFGPKWDEMYIMFMWISIGNSAFILAYSYQWLHLSLGTGRYLIKANLNRLLFTGVAVSIGINWGITGLAIAYAIYIWIFALFTAHSCAYHTKGRMMEFVLPLALPAVFALIGVVLIINVFSVSDPSISTMVIRTLILSLIYLLFSFVFYRKTLDDVVALLYGRKIIF